MRDLHVSNWPRKTNCTPSSRCRPARCAGLVLETGQPRPPRQIRVAEAWQLFDETVRFWRSWLAQSTYTGRWRETLERSAITLKLMTYAPSGGIVAAPTAALPEQIGGERNWDYRYTWVRDASFSVYALLGLGFTEEAAGAGSLAARSGPRAGWRRGRPAQHHVPGRWFQRPDRGDLCRTGRATRDPAPCGSATVPRTSCSSTSTARRSTASTSPTSLDLKPATQGWRRLSDLLDWLADNWNQPEEGIWETRGGRQDFTYGRLMSWVALDRGIRLADRHGRPAPLDRWRAERDAIYDQIMDAGWSEDAPGVRPALQDRCARLVAAAHVIGRLHLAHGSDVALHAGCDGPRACHRQPGVPLRSRRLT